MRRIIFLSVILMAIVALAVFGQRLGIVVRYCGEGGVVDEDPNPAFPPPHCG